VGNTYRSFVVDNLDRSQTVVALRRKGQFVLQPKADLVLEEGDDAFIISVDPPK
jgi:uncharacterized protein with PhoU and TrkA domain